MHTARFENAALGRSGIPPLEWILNSGRHGVSGGLSILNATWWDARDDTYDVIAVPSFRMIVDLSDLSASTSLHTTGQSGHPNHEHYDDMIERWVVNDPHPMRWTRDDVEDGEARTLTLIPVNG
jgi:penicillin amidase